MGAWTIMTMYVILLSFAFILRFLGGKWKTMLVIETKDKSKRTL
jgi:MATE family multidrug resistance protein